MSRYKLPQTETQSPFNSVLLNLGIYFQFSQSPYLATYRRCIHVSPTWLSWKSINVVSHGAPNNYSFVNRDNEVKWNTKKKTIYMNFFGNYMERHSEPIQSSLSFPERWKRVKRLRIALLLIAFGSKQHP